MAKDPNFARFYRDKVCGGFTRLVRQANDGDCTSFAISVTPNGGLIVHDNIGPFTAFASRHLQELMDVFCQAEAKRKAALGETSTPVSENTVLLPLPEKRWSQLTTEKMRALIPCYTRLLTGRGHPGWGKPGLTPPWWPEDIYPWSSITSKDTIFKKPAGLSTEEFNFKLQCVVRAAIAESGFDPDTFYCGGQPKLLDSHEDQRNCDSGQSERSEDEGTSEDSEDEDSVQSPVSEDEESYQSSSSVSEDDESHQSDDPGVQRGQQTTPTAGRLRLGEPGQPREDRRCPVYRLAEQTGQQTTPTTGRLRLGEPCQPREDRSCPVYRLAEQRGQQTTPATGRPRLGESGRQQRDDCRRLLYRPPAQREQQTSRITHPTTTGRPRLQGHRSDAHSQSQKKQSATRTSQTSAPRKKRPRVQNVPYTPSDYM